MPGSIALNPQTIVPSESTVPVLNPIIIASLDALTTDVDTHAVYITASLSYLGADAPAAAIVRCFRGGADTDGNVVHTDVQVGPDYTYGTVQDAPSIATVVRFIDPDPPAGGIYAITVYDPNDAGASSVTLISAVGFTF